MAYIDKLMGAGEVPVFVTRRHWTSIALKNLKWLVLAVLTLALAVGLGIYASAPEAPLRPYLLYIEVALAVLVLLELFGCALDIVRWQNQLYIITNWRVLHVYGVFNKTSIDSSLEKVNDVRLSQSWLGRLFDYGDIEIMTGSEMGVNQLDDIAHPVAFKTALLNEKEKLSHPGNYPQPGARPGQAAPQPSGNGRSAQANDIPALIDKLKALYDAGALTEQEYQTKKAELLKRM